MRERRARDVQTALTGYRSLRERRLVFDALDTTVLVRPDRWGLRGSLPFTQILDRLDTSSARVQPVPFQTNYGTSLFLTVVARQGDLTSRVN